MKKIVTAACAAAALAFPQAPASAADHFGKVAQDVHVDLSGQCVRFALEGVQTADPAQPGARWFVLRRDHPAFAELFAILLTGAAGKRAMNVHTFNYSCGGASEVTTIALN